MFLRLHAGIKRVPWWLSVVNGKQKSLLRESSVMFRENITGAEMIKKKMYKNIQKFKNQGYSRNEIAAELGIDPKTKAKYFKMDEEEFRA